MNVSKGALRAWNQYATTLNRTTETEFMANVYLIDCLSKYQYNDTLIQARCPFLMESVEYNSIFLKSSRALVEIGEILQENTKVCPVSEQEYEKRTDLLVRLLKYNQNLTEAIETRMWSQNLGVCIEA